MFFSGVSSCLKAILILITYSDTATQDGVDFYGEQLFKEDYYNTDCCNIEHDELIAHALQKNYHNFQCRSTQAPHEEDETFAKDWSYSLELAEEYAFDGEVGKWLMKLSYSRKCSVKALLHIPRINGEIPSVDEATLDHQRLLDRLQVYDLFERKVQGDGNCQFRALSDQFYLTPDHHEFVRQEVVNQLKSYPKTYEGYVPMAYGNYLEKMSRSGEWGDHVTLQAAADWYAL
ncbi:hypothetical protein GH714_002288 [Hevea brasiliensis]|uniref:OTU domain-containing protein n=1 Tax=Hevea brasiliensis TaxID=3981 RepID=A0A6A6K4G2_HEVBR|nr:hypothetical protein GH714_002288 [Hevea brasiliensis]